MTKVIIRLVVGLSCVGVSACGGGQKPVEDERAHTQRQHQASRSEDDMAISGTLGAIKQVDIERTMHYEVSKMARCFADQYSRIPYLMGDIELAFRIGTSGRVKWVYPSASTIGDHLTEKCILERAGAITFPKPVGGDAEFKYSFAMDAMPNVEAPAQLDSTIVFNQTASWLEAVNTSCEQAHGLHITAYLNEDGWVALGAGVDSLETLPHVECVLGVLMAQEPPNPGRAAKISFTLPTAS